MRSRRLASLLIGATLIAGLFVTTATSVFAANTPVTFVVLRQELPNASVDTQDRVFRDTDTIAGTGTTESITINASSTSPSSSFSVTLSAETGGTLTVGTHTGALATPDATHPGISVTFEGTLCVSNPGLFKIIQAPVFSGTDIVNVAAYIDITCPAAGFDEFAGLIAIASDHSLPAIVASPRDERAFGNVDIGGSGGPSGITFTNIGNVPFDASGTFLGGRYPDQYTMTDNCGTLAPGGSCTASVTYKPTKIDFHEASVLIPDPTMGLNREVLVSGTGLVSTATNTTPGTAINIATLPFYSGVQVQLVADTASSCGPDNKAAWYHFKSTTPKTVALSTAESDTATDLELFSGSAGSPTFIKCGVADVNSHDSLTFTATANVDYYIRLARDGSDYALVLKAVLGSADTMVDASGFATNYGSFFPVVDGYRDTVNISATRGETASASIAIYTPGNSKIRTLTVPSGIGAYSVAWDGKSTGGTLQAAGKYKIISTVTDTSGNHLSDTRYVTLSHRKLTTKTYTQTLDAGKYTQLQVTGTGGASRALSAYAGGLFMTSGTSGTVAAVYSFSAPSAISYTTVSFTVIGKGATNTMDVGLQDWTVCTAYSTTCITATRPGPHSSGTASATISAAGATTVYSTVHRIRGYLYAPTLPGTIRTLDARDVKITVTYKVLS